MLPSGASVTDIEGVQAVGPGCQDAAALLVAASQHHAEQDTQCQTILDTIRNLPASLPGGRAAPAAPDGALADAVNDCIDAAAWLPGAASQRQLLRAAIYGRSHAPKLVDVARIPQCAVHCRVINSLRSDTVRAVAEVNTFAQESTG